jgi:hypothetical protein
LPPSGRRRKRRSPLGDPSYLPILSFAHVFLLSVLDLTNPEADYNAFHNACFPAQSGHRKKVIYDETLRLAREIRPEAFGLNFDPIESSNQILFSISRLIDIPITAKLYKVTSFGPGCKFKVQKGTRGNHIGTLVVALPSHFEGGQIVLKNSRVKVTFDWSTSGRKDHPNDLHWVFFSTKIDHEILPVKTGHQLTVSYHIFGFRKEPIPDTEEDPVAHHCSLCHGSCRCRCGLPLLRQGNLDLQFKLTPLFSSLMSSYKDPKFLPKGGRLAFGLDHEYGVAGGGNVILPDDSYKGKDAMLVSILKAMGLSYRFKAVYEIWTGDSDCPPDEFATVFAEGSLLLVWDNFSGYDYYVLREWS